MKLKEILEELPCREVKGAADPDITAVTYDSRRVIPGALFVAVKGKRHDGHDFLADAVGRGAAAVVVERVSADAAAVSQVVVDDARRALAAAAAAFYRHPGRELAVVGVTGTNGKTTVAFVLDGIFRAAGYKTALASTVKNVVAGEERAARLTTAEAPELQALLREAADAGCGVAVVEVSSHALALSRVAGTPFAAAAFTNLSHDHLDFHGDMDSYFAAKASLLEQLAESAPAVVNVDDAYGRKLAASLSGRVVTYGVRETESDYRVANASSGWGGLSFTLACPDGAAVEIASPLPGSFDVLNCAAAFAVARELGVAADVARKGIAETPPVPGRLELVNVNDKLRVVIDYAHSPDSMEKALAEIRGLGADRVVAVFGCTGDRDVEKRPTMGALARRYADYAVVTTDDPYYEEPAAIARDVAAGIIGEGGAEPDDYRVILDRAQAIRFALSSVKAEEATVIAVLGKGHEEVQKVKGSEIRYSDRQTVEEIVSELGLAAAAAPVVNRSP
ncbi:MAG: UDP-N-acetylmuramoyl-L-alanyl-D-glutamate--2,6-diaminopimelate ligase [bacterium]